MGEVAGYLLLRPHSTVELVDRCESAGLVERMPDGVYHGSYVRWCERGRSDFLRLIGNDHRALIDGSAGREPAAFVVRRMQLEFLKPARIDEILEVVTRVKETTAAALVLDQRVSRDGVQLFTAEVMVVLVSQSGKPLRLSTALRDALQDRDRTP